jgi:hypothetical protein
MKPLFTFLFAVCLCWCVVGQDSTRFFDRLQFSWEAYNFYAPQSDKKTLLPKSIERNRFWGKNATDNPLYHGASAFGLRIESEIIKNYRIDIRFIAEHRGISYGVFSTNSMIVYPIFRVSFVDTIRFKNQKWLASGNAGQERDFQQGEGLYLYNLNCHAEHLRLQVHPQLIFEIFHIGDLSNGIGLTLDEVYQQSLIIPDIPLSKKRLNLQLTLTQWKGYIKSYRNFENAEQTFVLPEISASLPINSALKIYTHLGFKNVKNPYQTDSAVFFTPKTIDKFAGVLGIKWQPKTEKWAFKAIAEARFYGKAFNFERANMGTLYRASGWYRPSYGYNATIGDNLYPLSSYDRPFSQWGVFTEYQNKNVGALTLRAKGNRHLKGRLYWYFDGDYNAIFAENEKPFHYFFATTGFNYKFRNDIDCILGMTNKGMNLDVYYPTFYFHPKMSQFVCLKKPL